MIKIENAEVTGWEHAIRGMRNPMNSWEKSDSEFCHGASKTCKTCPDRPYNDYTPCGCVAENIGKMYVVGPNDLALMKKLIKAGTDHRKFMRMITVYVDITAPLYWWKEFDTYKVGTVANSCSTMHKIAEKEFGFADFSHEHLWGAWDIDVPEHEADTDCYLENEYTETFLPFDILEGTIKMLNRAREKFLETKDKKYWWQMVQLLPSSYNQKRTIMMNYEVLANIYKSRKNHKLDEWRDLCKWIESLPYSELITGISGNLVRYKYEVNTYTGKIVVDESASDDEIRLAIMDDLYNVTYEKMK